MVAACGKEVTELQRLSMGPLSLPNDLETWCLATFDRGGVGSFNGFWNSFGLS